MRCARCGGSLVRGDDGPECLMCGRPALAPAETPERMAALVAERASLTEGGHHQRNIMCHHCGRMFAGTGMGAHRRVCGR